MFYYLVSKNTCHRNNDRYLGFMIKWCVISNKFSNIINSTLYIILFINDDRWIRWTETWQSPCIVTYHTFMGSSLLQWFFIIDIPALKVFLIYKLFLQNKNLAVYKHSVNFMAPNQILKIQKIIDKNVAKRYPFLTLNCQSSPLVNLGAFWPKDFPNLFAKFDSSPTFRQIFVFVFFELRGRT